MLRVNAAPSLELGDNQRFVPVVISEFPSLALCYPILFSKDADTGQFYCGAMLGFDDGENLFIDSQADKSTYRPLNLRRAPFTRPVTTWGSTWTARESVRRGNRPCLATPVSRVRTCSRSWR